MTQTRQSAAPVIDPAMVPALTAVPGPNGVASSNRGYHATRVLWDERRFLLRVVLRGLLLSLLIAFLIPSDYESTTQLMPPDGQASPLGMLAALGARSGIGGGAFSWGADLLGLRSSGALFVSLLNSDSVRDDLIDRFDLRRVYWTRTYRSARKNLAKRTDIEEDKKSGVISITVSDHDPQRAAAMGQAYVQELNQLVTSLNTSSAHRERVFLEDRLKVVKKDLDEASRVFSDFSSKNTAIDIKEQGKAMVEAAATLQGEAIAAESELRGLEQIYTPENVRVRSVQARLTELKRQLNKLGGSAPGDPTTETSPDMYPSIRQLPVLGVTYADLYRHVKIDETVYEILTQEYELARVEEAKQVPSVKVIDPAKRPERRSGPSRLLIFLGGGLFSFCVAAAWIFGKEAWDGTKAEDPRKLLATEMASTVKREFRWRTARDLTLDIVSWRSHKNGSNNGNRS